MNGNFIKLFFLCEDGRSLSRAEALKEKLAHNTRDQVIVEAHFCEYARLNHPLLRENAIVHATGSDMIIISARGTEPVPETIQGWLNEVGALCSEKIVCAEFLDAPSPDKAAIFHRFMDKWASQCGSFLFSNLFPQTPAPALLASLGNGENRLPGLSPS